eukprot:COSAG02_NODE_9411_length_2225_cov_1.619003_1_plen_103_part_10
MLLNFKLVILRLKLEVLRRKQVVEVLCHIEREFMVSTGDEVVALDIGLRALGLMPDVTCRAEDLAAAEPTGIGFLDPRPCSFSAETPAASDASYPTASCAAWA